MSDVNCPYCKKEQEINHDDGYGYEENEKHEQECRDCQKYFAFTTSIVFHYKADRADCLNGGNHKYKPTTTVPRQYTRMYCVDCGFTRKPNHKELTKILWEEE